MSQSQSNAATPNEASAGWVGELRKQGALFVRWLVNLYHAHLPSHVSRQFIQNRFLQVASSLAYQTILSMVPLIVVGFSLSNVFMEDASQRLLTFLLTNFIPVKPDQINEILTKIPSVSSPQAVGAVGLGTLLLLSMTLLSNIEKALNDIWRASSSRPLMTKFINFYAILTLAPMLLSLGLYLAFQITDKSSFLATLLPALLTFIAFFVCYKLLPEPKTRWRATFFGAFIGSSFFELSKWGFSIYLSYAADKTYANIYGVLAILPLFFVWVYIGWIVFLLGAQVAYSVQNVELLAELERQQDPARRSEDLFDQASDEAAVRLFFEISEAYQKGAEPPDDDTLAISIPMPALTVRFLLERFRQRGLVRSTETGGFVPARPPNQIFLLELVEGLRTPKIALDYNTMTPALRKALEDLRAARQKSLADISFEAISPSRRS